MKRNTIIKDVDDYEKDDILTKADEEYEERQLQLAELKKRKQQALLDEDERVKQINEQRR